MLVHPAATAPDEIKMTSWPSSFKRANAPTCSRNFVMDNLPWLSVNELLPIFTTILFFSIVTVTTRF